MRLCFSSCPNDTFVFHALLHNKVDTEGLVFDTHIADIDQLNSMAAAAKADVVKISFAAYPLAMQHYCLLDAGSALGYGNGPLLVAQQGSQPIAADTKVALPGMHTTAALLMQQAFPQVQHYVPMLFSHISAAVKNVQVDAGVLIHESRFTYAQQGLQLVADLGEWWQTQHHLPIPLGGIAIRRSLPAMQQQAFARVLRRSVDYALQNPTQSTAFVQHYAQELSPQVIEQHIKMFVNHHTQSLGEEGRQAICKLLQYNNLQINQPIFL
ncbi:1,4-dihydroxy-6-naphtoate synthase [Bacteroidia bacterium]|nr:1,4-dihydroxy-6-naphtoate synthase [Bacteroidia bacterium]